MAVEVRVDDAPYDTIVAEVVGRGATSVLEVVGPYAGGAVYEDDSTGEPSVLDDDVGAYAGGAVYEDDPTGKPSVLEEDDVGPYAG